MIFLFESLNGLLGQLELFFSYVVRRCSLRVVLFHLDLPSHLNYLHLLMSVDTLFKALERLFESGTIVQFGINQLQNVKVNLLMSVQCMSDRR